MMLLHNLLGDGIIIEYDKLSYPEALYFIQVVRFHCRWTRGCEICTFLARIDKHEK